MDENPSSEKQSRSGAETLRPSTDLSGAPPSFSHCSLTRSRRPYHCVPLLTSELVPVHVVRAADLTLGLGGFSSPCVPLQNASLTSSTPGTGPPARALHYSTCLSSHHHHHDHRFPPSQNHPASDQRAFPRPLSLPLPSWLLRAVRTCPSKPGHVC